MNSKAHDKLIAARIALLLDHSFWGELAMFLKLVERPEIPTLAVDGKHIFYNPEFVLGLSTDLTKSAFVHEIGHCMLEHFLRRNGREPRTWNRAGDYVINLMLKDAGFAIGKEWLLDECFRDMSTEHVYDILKQDEGQGGGGGDGDAMDEVLDGASSEADAIEKATEWKMAVTNAARKAREQGNLPAGVKRFVEAIENPQVPWREVLQRFVTQTSKNDYTWMRPNRRYIAHGLVMPSLHSENMEVLTCGIDTSGSIDQPTLNAFAAEIIAAFHGAHPEKLVNIYCDAVVAHVDEFEHGDEPTFAPHGGGGTDLRKIFDHIADSDIKPACLIVLTDGYTPYPDEAPEYPVLWCMTTDQVAPFGDTLRIEV